MGLKCEQGSRTKQWEWLWETGDGTAIVIDVGVPTGIKTDLGFICEVRDASADGAVIPADVEYDSLTGEITITEGATAFAAGDSIKLLTWFYSEVE